MDRSTLVWLLLGAGVFLWLKQQTLPRATQPDSDLPPGAVRTSYHSYILPDGTIVDTF
jgi:hypothetical protein